MSMTPTGNGLTSSAQAHPELALAERLRRRYLRWAVYLLYLLIACMVLQILAYFVANHSDNPEPWLMLRWGSAIVQLALLPFFVPTMWLGFHYAKRAQQLRDAHAH
jgi:hypothetical protein